MNFLIQLGISLVLLIISYLIAPRPKNDDPQAEKLSDDDFPIANEGASVPIVFGLVVLDAPNVVWWGDADTRPIKSDGGSKK